MADTDWLEEETSNAANVAGVTEIKTASEPPPRIKEAASNKAQVTKAEKPKKEKINWENDPKSKEGAKGQTVTLSAWHLEVLQKATELDGKSNRFRLKKMVEPLIEQLAKDIESGKLD